VGDLEGLDQCPAEMLPDKVMAGRMVVVEVGRRYGCQVGV